MAQKQLKKPLSATITFYMHGKPFSIDYKGKKLVVGWYVRDTINNTHHKVTKLGTNEFRATGKPKVIKYASLSTGYYEIVKHLDQPDVTANN